MKQNLFILLLLSLTVSAFGQLRVGAECTEDYFPKLASKRIALVANQSSLVGSTHLVDSLLSAGFDIRRIFSPEHGFRGKADAGEKVQSGKDAKTGLEIISLYGSNRKPDVDKLQDVDVVLFDLQDVGVRFYTYFATMHYVMEACAEAGVTIIVLDRPNPNGNYIDGPILEDKYQSFVGKHPVPLVHGMTAAEYAQMINREGWLANGISCRLDWVVCDGYTHSSHYNLPIPPSPNLPNALSIQWYPTLGLFEGVNMSIGRGTYFPFQVIGHPSLPKGVFAFTPESRPGAAKSPRFMGEQCNGYDLRNNPDYKPENEINLKLILQLYSIYPNKDDFFKAFFLNLSGTADLKNAIIAGNSEAEIRQMWKTNLESFYQIRKKYLLYEDDPELIKKFSPGTSSGNKIRN